MNASLPIRDLKVLGLALGAFVLALALWLPGQARAAFGDDFGIIPGTFEADAFQADSTTPERQAGAHPFEGDVAFELIKAPVPGFEPLFPDIVAQADGYLHTVESELPRGFTGLPAAVSECTPAQLRATEALGDIQNGCPPSAQVGVIALRIQNALFLEKFAKLAVFRVKPPPGVLARFGFAPFGRPIYIDAHLDPFDYSIDANVEYINNSGPLQAQKLTLWGKPADPVHDNQRCIVSSQESKERAIPTGEIDETRSCSAEVPTVKPFLSMPTQCGVPGQTALRVDSWQHPGVFDEPPAQPQPAAVLSGCNQLEFNPSISAKPSTNIADAPSGLHVGLHFPQNEDPDGLATAQLKDAVVSLPAGLTVNPSSADGLGACTPAQIGLQTAVGDPIAHFDGAEPQCPDSSKLGTASVKSPALDHPLPGAIYLASQGDNPFGSLLALYLVIDDSQSGAIVKLPGKVTPDPVSGQLTASFRENPQLPVEDVVVDFFEGPRASLRTPASCGAFTTTATLTPWTTPEGADATRSDSFQITQGAGGGACVGSDAQQPNTPAFTAGTQDPTAAAYSPFVLRLARADGSQQLKAIDATLPKGLVGKLTGIPYCPDGALAAAASRSGKEEQASPSCPVASQVGSVDVAAGAGPTPLHVGGTAYLAGPYKGAPLSLAIVTPAVAGPFDLGTVVVRTALNVDPETAQIHAVSDQIPQILQGIPLDLRSITLKVDKPGFTLNPTSCNPMAITGQATSVFDQAAGLSSPFQVGDCARLGFKPKLRLRLKGGAKRSDHPALTAILTQPGGQANIARASVALPHSEFLAQNHIRTICTRVQYAARQCPPGSIYGKASAVTPLLDQPLSGPVYLRSSSNKLPDLVASLDGQIHIDLVGRIDSFRTGIRTTFETVPDAPVTRFTLQMQGGKKGLLENSRNLCRSVNRATVEMDAQSGKAYEATPALQVASCRKAKHHKGKHGGHKRHADKKG